MSETVVQVSHVEGAGWQVSSEGKVLATLRSQVSAKDRATLIAKRIVTQGGIGVVRIFAKEGGSFKEHAHGRVSVRRRIARAE